MKRSWVIALMFAFSPPVLAGKVYRCPDGSYQDKPCGQGERVVAHNNPQSAAPPDADPACFQRGRAAARLVAQRDKGVSADKVLRDIDAGAKPYEQRVDEKAFVVKVFQTKGSVGEVATLMEAECMNEKRAQAAKEVAPAPAGATPLAAPESTAPKAVRKEDGEIARLCRQLKADARENKAQSRKGGSAAEMDDLAEQRREIETQLKELCAS